MLHFEEINRKFQIMLGSKSPRRRHLLAEAGFQFEILPTIETDERFPDEMPHEEVPIFLAKEKAKVYMDRVIGKHLLITADTIVSLENEILGKPDGIEGARTLLKKLSGKCHKVYSGVCLTAKEKQVCFGAVTNVYFKELTMHEIDYYLEKYKPLDKAGAYGIQEWIGYIGVEKIEGSFYNVMGLPVQKLYLELIQF